MRVVVTGATGNLGSAFLRRCALEGHEVVGVARRAPGPALATLAAQWVALDLAHPEGSDRLVSALEGADALVHLAWALQPMRDRGYQRRVNVAGSTLALVAARRAGVGQVVLASSIAAYAPGRPRALVDESWPTTGVPRCGYSQDKAALEGVLRDLAGWPTDATMDRTRVAWVRPGLVAQRAAGSELMRYGLPLLTPRRLLRHLPFLGLDRGLRLQLVHADDVADAVARILERRSAGPFNLTAGPGLGPVDVAAAFRARPVPVPWQVTRAAASLAWWARIGPLDPGWITMAHTIPGVSTERARSVLEWTPRHDGASVLRELVDGMADAAGAPSAALRPHRHRDELARLVRQGPLQDRPDP